MYTESVIKSVIYFLSSFMKGKYKITLYMKYCVRILLGKANIDIKIYYYMQWNQVSQKLKVET